MTINGSFASFKSWMGDNPNLEARAVLYRTGAQGKVVALLFPLAEIEWEFPANETVTIALLRTALRFFIEVTSWTI